MLESAACRSQSFLSSDEFQSVCPSEPHVQYTEVLKWAPTEDLHEWRSEYKWFKQKELKAAARKAHTKPPSGSTIKIPDPPVAVASRMNEERFKGWLDGLPAGKRELSPVFLEGGGMNMRFDAKRTNSYLVEPVDKYVADLPDEQARPIKLFSLAQAPGVDQDTAAAADARSFNSKMAKSFAASNKKTGHAISQGGWAGLDFFSVTDGAARPDGTFHGYQVVMEQTQLLLNVLDVIWAEAVADGGMRGTILA